MREHESIPPELSAIAEQLQGLVPQSRLDRDAVLFAAGQRAGRRRTWAASGATAASSALLVAVLMGTSLLRFDVPTGPAPSIIANAGSQGRKPHMLFDGEARFRAPTVGDVHWRSPRVSPLGDPTNSAVVREPRAAGTEPEPQIQVTVRALMRQLAGAKPEPRT